MNASHPNPGERVAEDQVRATIHLKDGRRIEEYIEHVIGSAKNPMSDSQLEAKFRGLANGVLQAPRIDRLIEMCWTAAALPNVAELARAAAS